ncbi:MAG: ABC transporter permease [Anaerolineae bacterium]|nr:ABC transporter permease [Anaerolineae bacterium]
MRKIWLVLKREYIFRVGKRSFLVSTLWVPVLIAIIMGVAYFSEVGRRGKDPVGYVDYANILLPDALPALDSTTKHVALEAFDSEETAQAALEDGRIQAFYVIPEDYVTEQSLSLYYWEEEPKEAVQKDFRDYIKASILYNFPAAQRKRAFEGFKVTLQATNSDRQVDSSNILEIIIPFGAAFLFMILVTNSAGYLLDAITDEKENRTLEVMVTSLRPEQLITGKALALMSVTLTQVLIWCIAVALGSLVIRQFWTFLDDTSIPWSLLSIIALYCLPAFTLVAGIMIAIGSIAVDTRQAQQLSGIINFIFVTPIFMSGIIAASPDHPILIGLTLFPPTSFTAITLRWAFTQVPVWQLASSWLLLTGSALGSLWIASRLFRAGMLHYGQQFTFKDIVNTVRSALQ